MTLVAKTTMASIDENFALSKAVATICTWRWSADGRVLVGFNVFVSGKTGPFEFALGLKPPAVVKAASRTGMAAVDEDALRLGSVLRRRDSNVLRSCHRLFTLDLNFFPSRLV